MSDKTETQDLPMSALRKPLPVLRLPQAIVISEPGFGAALGLDERESPVVPVPPDTLAHIAADPRLHSVLSWLMQFLASDPRRVQTVSALLSAASAAARTGEAVTLRLAVSPQTGALDVVVVADASPASALSPGMVRALARGQERVAAILSQPDMLNSAKFAGLLDISHQTLAEWRAQRKVLALLGEKRGFRFPAWQLTEDGALLPRLRDLHHALRDQPWLVYRFLTRNHPDLGNRTGLEALKSGDIDATIEAARAESDTFS